MSGPTPHKKNDDAEQEAWLITYADAITLVTLFFLLLLSMANFDVSKYEQAAAGITRDIANRDEQSPTSLLKIDLQDVIFGMQADQAVEIGSDDRGVVIELQSGAFFKPGSAEIRDEAIPVLQKMTQTFKAPRYEFYMVEIEGHTDDVPIKTDRFPSNWELSAGRASRVVRFFVDEQMDAWKFKAVGYGDTRPKAPHRDAQGKPIVENQAINRRVTIHVTPMSYKERKMFAKKIEVESMEKKAAPPAATQPSAAAPSTASQPSAAAAPAAAQPAAPAPAQPRPQAATAGTAAPARTTPAK